MRRDLMFTAAAAAVVPLKNGCQVPADGVLFVANSLKVAEQEVTASDEIV
jgi:Ca2+-transporting ATPase